jgi:hypothetical protein
VAISSHSKLFINTDCFNQVLNRIWYNKLSYSDKSFFTSVKFGISLLTFGLLAPCCMTYCLTEDIQKHELPQNYQYDADEVSVRTIEVVVKIYLYKLT